MWAALAELLTKAFVAFWKEWRARRDIQEGERLRLALEASRRAVEALEWKAGAGRDPDAGRLRGTGEPPKLPGDDPGRPGN